MHTNCVGLTGEEIKKLRAEMGLSRNQLAEQLGISPRSLEQIELGRKVSPPVGKLARLILVPIFVPVAQKEQESVDMDGEDLLMVRRELGFSREEMAEKLGISTQALIGMEQDKIAIPTTIEKFALLLQKFCSAEGKSKMELWRMLLDEKEKHRMMREYRERSSF